jgi:hypothetical protein
MIVPEFKKKKKCVKTIIKTRTYYKLEIPLLSLSTLEKLLHTCTTEVERKTGSTVY